jgi:phage shock protein A
MFITRLINLLSGKLRRWLKAREARDPEAVYESAIAERLRRYQQLKSAAAGVIYMRNKLARELEQKSLELREVEDEAAQAVDINEDQCALILIARKHELEADCARLREDLSELTVEAEDAKKNLVAFKGEIENLKVEKVAMIARLKNAQARVRIQRVLEELTTDEDVLALEEVRESIHRTLAEAGVSREMRSADVAEKLERIRAQKEFARAREELEELKRRRRGLVPIELFTATADGSANGNPNPAE